MGPDPLPHLRGKSISKVPQLVIGIKNVLEPQNRYAGSLNCTKPVTRGHVKRRGHHHGDLRQQGAGAAERDGEVVTDGGLLQHRQPHVRIPSEAAATVRRRGRWATQSSVGGEDGDAAMVVSPHKVVARRAAAHSSVLEGAGRMLKGCDLHHVRNAVLCRTGFLD
ncbi:hypothetical protein [Oryza sativa Japonica Group]|uniref:Uncharacterized protein n=1 Tax=Oryza sativa subsp. japonica TaxID=39947 RepID=Q5NAR4_ORYSJ|nr:hypothetical protein [Oryza sativa Japonica Group]